MTNSHTGVPPVAIHWLAQNAACDVDLARLSNVNQEWRRLVGLSISNTISMSPLLLPSIVRFAKNNGITEEYANSNSSPTQLQSNLTCDARMRRDTFCAAWFAPSGIQDIPVLTHPFQNYQAELFGRNRGEISRNCDCCCEWKGYRLASQVLSPFGYNSTFVNDLISSFGHIDTNGSEPTPAVRGATRARPEGYCECWDSTTEERVINDDGSYKPETVLFQKRRNNLQRQFLPRVVRTSLWKNGQNPNLIGKQQRTLQFLNASGSNAVRLFTPPFACGPLSFPITVLCVGIATEDGCFLSGLSSRCEFGHMYPQNERDHMIDMSSVCISYDSVAADLVPMTDHDECDDDSSAAIDAPDCCTCPFYRGQTFDSESVNGGDDYVKPPAYLHKGTIGPGQWHCYTAIINGADTTIRIDGTAETMMNSIKDSVGTGGVALDGLTIGSDHSFNLSLCFGNGGPGEGEGSISELIVFQGQLPLQDLEALEDHLMQKHGITPVEAAAMHQEDEWKRTSRALIEQSAPYDSVIVSDNIPLQVVANDPSVSWHRKNPVTGEPIQVTRIGCRWSQESSDW